jgi:hypothetical protein
MAETDDIFGSTGNVGAVAGVESSLSPYAGPYVTDMLGRGQALADMPFEAYTGPYNGCFFSYYVYCRTS